MLKLFTRPLAAAALVCAPAVAQTPPAAVPQQMPAALPAVVQARAVVVEKAAPEVRVEVRVVSVGGKDGRAAVARLFDAKGQEGKTACLTDKQLLAVLEACTADPATTVLQAPRVVAPAGEPANVVVADTHLFTTAVTVKSVGGKTVTVPTTEAVETGMRFTATATPSADGRFVKLKVAFRDKQLKPNTPLLPVTTFVLPEGDAKDAKPVPFTQFVQMPKFEEASVDGTAVLPDGGTMAVHAGTRTQTRRVESKVPVLSDIPYLDRLFRNVGVRQEECDLVLFATATRVPEVAAVVPPQVVRATAAVPAPDAELAKLVAEYHRACAAGKKDEAMRLAVQALAKDPTCFGK